MPVTQHSDELGLKLPLVHSGKVRDTFAVDEDLLMVASDRVSAFDVVMPTLIPDKGKVLNQLSAYWFNAAFSIVPHHLITTDLAQITELSEHNLAILQGRAMLVKKCQRIDIECVVRGYLAGSAWTEYQQSGTVAGRHMAENLVESDRLPAPIFTPAMKNDTGHDENISVRQLRSQVGVDLATALEEKSLALYQFGANLAQTRGLVLADTKFEFGFRDGELTLIDELLTPDSSRYWDINEYQPGRSQDSFDKQYLRDWLVESGWNREPSGPELPVSVIEGTRSRYIEAYRRIADDVPEFVEIEQ